MRKQHYMTEQERHQLEAMRRNKIPVREIARQLGFCERTIYYELRRGSYMHTCEFWDEKRYSAQKGQQKHRYNQTAKGRPLKIGSDHAFAAYIEHKQVLPCGSSGSGTEAPFCYEDMRQHTVQLHRQKGVLSAGQPTSLGEVEKESQDRGGRAAGSAPEAAQHREQAGTHRAAL